MNKKERELYQNKKPIGVYCDSNWGGLEVIDINDEFIVCRFNYGTPGTLHRVKLNYGVNTISFRVNRRTFKCSNILRV